MRIGGTWGLPSYLFSAEDGDGQNWDMLEILDYDSGLANTAVIYWPQSEPDPIYFNATPIPEPWGDAAPYQVETPPGGGSTLVYTIDSFLGSQLHEVYIKPEDEPWLLGPVLYEVSSLPYRSRLGTPATRWAGRATTALSLASDTGPTTRPVGYTPRDVLTAPG
ncbi:hypothetical protein IIA79_05670 [bacterium]|nr:hypothetical protein [bacterium]